MQVTPHSCSCRQHSLNTITQTHTHNIKKGIWEEFLGEGKKQENVMIKEHFIYILNKLKNEAHKQDNNTADNIYIIKSSDSAGRAT